MAEILEQLGIFIQDLIRTIGYPGITLLVFMENVFPPTPAETVMPFAGFLVGRGEINFIGVLAAGVLGATLGSLTLYYIGVWADERLVRSFLRRYGRYITVTENDLDQAMNFFSRYGHIIVLLARFTPIPLVRTAMSLVAGMNRMPPLKFIAFTALGSAIWSGIWLTAGVVLGENWQTILNFVNQNEAVSWFGIIALAALVLTFFIIRLRRLKVAEQTQRSQQPLDDPY